MSLLRNTPEACKATAAQNYENYRYLNKTNTGNERSLFATYWDELIGRYGTRLEYYTYNYSLSTHDFIYGEEPTASFATPRSIVMVAEMKNAQILLSRFGIDTNADITFVVTMRDYTRIFGQNVEPKAGDVIRLNELGWDVNEVPGYGSATNPTSAEILDAICKYKDPNNRASIVYPPTADVNGNPISGCQVWMRSPQLFEITERRHQDMMVGINTLMGHYVWIIDAKRFDYSYQPGIEPECFQGVVGEGTRTGLLSGFTQPQSPDKGYPQNINDESRTIWDYTSGDQARNTNPYGEYA